MIHRYACWKRRKRSGSSLVEMLIALVILAVMLFSIMAVMILTAQSTVSAKEGSVAYQTSLSELEKMEAVPVLSSASDVINSNLGSYELTRDTVTGSRGSADIKIKAAWSGAKLKSDVTVERQVSPSAWQNAGQEPNR